MQLLIIKVLSNATLGMVRRTPQRYEGVLLQWMGRGRTVKISIYDVIRTYPLDHSQIIMEHVGFIIRSMDVLFLNESITICNFSFNIT